MESEEITRLPAALIQGLGGIPTPTLSDALDRLGLAGVLGGIRPVVSGLRCAGTAFTVAEVTAELGAYTSEEFQRERMLDLTEPGDVLVIDNSGRPISSWGGTITFAAKNHGLAGLVVDGAVRDYEEIAEVGFAAFSRHVVPTTGRLRSKVIAFNRAIRPAGVEVCPGDIMVGDGSGVVRIPAARAAELLEIATELDAIDRKLIGLLKQGLTFAEARKQTRVP